MNPEDHREWLRLLSQAEIDWAWKEYVRLNGESERDTAVRDTNAIIEGNSRAKLCLEVIS